MKKIDHYEKRSDYEHQRKFLHLLKCFNLPRNEQVAEGNNNKNIVFDIEITYTDKPPYT
jgi:hypothetical protein